MKPSSKQQLAAPEKFNGSFAVGDKSVIPVLSSTVHTVDFRRHPNAVLYSDGVTACTVLVIKNFNEETEKYDNVVTMAHFFPNNAYDVRTAQGNIYQAMQQFVDKGGELSSSKTSFILFGGHDFPSRPLNSSAKAIVSDAIKEMGIPSKCKFKDHNSSIITDPNQSIAVFVDSNGTQITKRNLDRRVELETLAEAKISMPLEFLQNVIYSAPEKYNKFADALALKVGIASLSSNGMGLLSMNEVIGDHLKSTTPQQRG